MQLKKLFWIVLLPLVLSACSAGKRYFNKRIDHSYEETQEQSLVVQEKAAPVAVNPLIGKEEALVQTGTGNKVKPEEAKPEAKVEVKPAIIVKEPKPSPLTATVKSVKAIVKKADRKIQKLVPKPSSMAYLDGGGIILVVAGSIFLLTFLISLLLGYTVGQAALYGLLAILIIIVLLVWLATRNGSDTGSSYDGADDDNDDD